RAARARQRGRRAGRARGPPRSVPRAPRGESPPIARPARARTARTSGRRAEERAKGRVPGGGGPRPGSRLAEPAPPSRQRARRRPRVAPGSGTRAIRRTVLLRYRLGTRRFDDHSNPRKEREMHKLRRLLFAVAAVFALSAIAVVPALGVTGPPVVNDLIHFADPPGPLDTWCGSVVGRYSDAGV